MTIHYRAPHSLGQRPSIGWREYINPLLAISKTMRKRHRAQNRLHKLTFELKRLGDAVFSFEASLDKILEKRFHVKKTTRKMFYAIGDKNVTHDQLIEQLEEFKFAVEKIEDAIRSNMDSNDKYTKSYIRQLDSLLEKGPKMHRGELPSVSQLEYKLEILDNKLVKVDENYDEMNDNENDSKNGNKKGNQEKYNGDGRYTPSGFLFGHVEDTTPPAPKPPAPNTPVPKPPAPKPPAPMPHMYDKMGNGVNLSDM